MKGYVYYSPKLNEFHISENYFHISKGYMKVHRIVFIIHIRMRPAKTTYHKFYLIGEL